MAYPTHRQVRCCGEGRSGHGCECYWPKSDEERPLSDGGEFALCRSLEEVQGALAGWGVKLARFARVA